jgi:hypothetical protein
MERRSFRVYTETYRVEFAPTRGSWVFPAETVSIEALNPCTERCGT